MFIRFMSVAFLIFLSGCSSLKDVMDVEKPTASVTSVSIDSVSMKSMVLLVEVKLDNPNAFDLKTAGVDLDLLMNKRIIAKINQPDASVSLPAGGSNSIRLPVKLMFDQILDSVGEMSNKKALDYMVEGAVVINLPVIGDFDVPVDYSGMLSLPKQFNLLF